ETQFCKSCTDCWYLNISSGGAYHLWIELTSPSGGAYHRLLVLEYFIRWCVPPMDLNFEAHLFSTASHDFMPLVAWWKDLGFGAG
ncbi:hypothetical protein AVEN_3622-1, partial [Araneus ventricosus]